MCHMWRIAPRNARHALGTPYVPPPGAFQPAPVTASPRPTDYVGHEAGERRHERERQSSGVRHALTPHRSEGGAYARLDIVTVGSREAPSP